MELIKDLLPFLTFLVGGGFAWLLNFRRRARRESQKLDEEEFNAVSAIVERSLRQLSEMSEKIQQLEAAKVEMAEKIQRLSMENKRLEQTLARYIRQANNMPPQ